MKYYIVAGEASGDLHASNLMKALKEQDAQADFRFFGGDLMQSVGGTLVKHHRELAYMGVIQVVLHLRTILRNMKICRTDIRNYRPDVVILVDYPSFNLKIAKYVKSNLHIPVYYYISPKIWAWKKYRIRSFRRYVDRMFCILPFEKEFYRNLNYSIDYVGNPTVDAVDFHRRQQQGKADTFLNDNGLNEKPILALLSGSRKQEIEKNLPVMIDVATSFPAYQWVIAGAPSFTLADYKPCMNGKDIPIVFGQTYSLLEHSHTALVNSGTATLETGLFRVPQVVCYYLWGGTLVNFIFKHFFQAPYISLVNLIAGREVVQELFGGKFTRKHIHAELNRLLSEPLYRNEIEEGYDEMIAILGQPGASQRTATLIIQSFQKV
ncbi:MAG: lipid-A-disaccharide synthase [Tannerella sp.]|jgi:lipid-A-disaccharide synthase|nr:lipid-A-disaccharide synthase [Tannerella sp.]